MLNKLMNFLRPINSRQTQEYAYLCNAENAYDLERRMKEIDRGEAPFQRANALFVGYR